MKIKTKRKIAGITCGIMAAIMIGSTVMSTMAYADTIQQGGWINTNGVWSYNDPIKYTPVTGLQDIGGVYYYFDEAGVMQIGKHIIDNEYYIFAPNGALQTGWINYNGFWYYGDSTGKLLSGLQKIGDKTYFLSQYNGDDYGKLVGGWVKTKNNNGDAVYYYFDALSGEAYTGVHKIGENTYSFAADGRLSKDKEGNLPSVNGSVTNEVLYSVSYKNSSSDSTKDSSVSSSIRSKINKYIKMIPTPILVNFFDKNKLNYDSKNDYVYRETITSESFDGDDDEDSKSETTYINYIYRYSGNSLDFCKDPINVLRGFGRFIDEYAVSNSETYKSVGKPSETNEFEACMDAEADGIAYNNDLEFDGIEDNSRNDYFDLCYALFILGDKEFKESCPMSYNYVQKIQQIVIESMRNTNSNDDGHYTANFVSSIIK